MLKKMLTYLRNVRTELAKVSWPKRDQLIESTGITLVLSLTIAIFIFVVDIIVSRVINVLI